MSTVSLWMTLQPITSRFGTRAGFTVPHKGVDFGFGRNVPVSAWGKGVVVAAGKHPEYGYYVRIRHAAGIETSYHSLLRKPDLYLGQEVAMFQVIGHAGKSAQAATGYHLHVGLWLGGTPRDPLAYLAPGQVRSVSFSPIVAGAAVITVDGVLGPQTVRQLQGVLKVRQDGKLGPQTVAALQGRLGAYIDGKLGRQTVRALQRRLGVVVDGKLGRQTVTALQRRLNATGTL